MRQNLLRTHIFALLLLPILLGGCSLTKLTVGRTVIVYSQAGAALQREADLTLIEASVRGNLKTFEGMLEIVPENPTLLIMTSRAFSSYAGFVEDKMEDAEIAGDADTAADLRARAIDYYGRSRRYALKVLSQSNKTFSEAPTVDSAVFEGALRRLKKPQVEPLFWAAYAWARGISLQKDNPMQVIDLPRVEAMMRRVIELDETFYYGGAHLFFTVYYGDRAASIGGNPEKAMEHIKHVDRINQDRFLLSKFYLARYYAYPQQNAALYKEALQAVLDAPMDVYPGHEAATAIAKSRAKRWLAQADALFDTATE